MPIKDLKSKIDKLENLLNAKTDIPAEWALDVARVDLMPVEQFRRTRTEEEILQEALCLTETYGTRENYIQAIANAPPVDLTPYRNPHTFSERECHCDICNAELRNKAADFCKACHEKYPKKIQEIVEYRKRHKC